MPRGLSDYDSAVIQGRLWTPEVLRPAGWWDAADISTMSFATGVSELRDKSGNGRHATQSTPANQPTLVSVSQNGRSALSFDGSNDTLSLNAAAVTASMALAAAVRPAVTGGGTAYRGITATDTSSGSGSSLNANNGTSGPNSDRWGTWETSNNSANSQLQANVSYILIMDGLDSGSFWRDGASDGSYAATQGQPSLSHIGGAPGGVPQQQFNGLIFEVFWIPVALSYVQRVALEGYLSWKWAIPLAASHPYANRPPLIGD
jgi:hypothetical protein